MNLKTLDNWVSSSQCSPAVFDTASVGTADMDRWVSATWGPPVIAVSAGTTPSTIELLVMQVVI